MTLQSGAACAASSGTSSGKITPKQRLLHGLRLTDGQFFSIVFIEE